MALALSSKSPLLRFFPSITPHFEPVRELFEMLENGVAPAPVQAPSMIRSTTLFRKKRLVSESEWCRRSK
jgi:hypothetical protein